MMFWLIPGVLGSPGVGISRHNFFDLFPSKRRRPVFPRTKWINTPTYHCRICVTFQLMISNFLKKDFFGQITILRPHKLLFYKSSLLIRIHLSRFGHSRTFCLLILEYIPFGGFTFGVFKFVGFQFGVLYLCGVSFGILCYSLLGLCGYKNGFDRG